MQNTYVEPSTRQIIDLLHRERFSEALRLLGSDPGSSASDATRLSLRAEALAGLAEFDKARSFASQALDIDPRDARAHYVLGLVASAFSQLQEAVQHFTASIASDQSFAPAHYSLGKLTYGAGYRDAAARELTAAATLDPDNWRFAAGTALLLPPKQQLKELRAAYRKGLAEQPGSVRLRARLVGTFVAQPLRGLAGNESPANPELSYQAYQQIMSKTPVVTYSLLVVNALVFLWLEMHGGSTDPAVLEKYGAKDSFAIIHLHQWWRLFTAAFLHAGFPHLLVNSLSLYFVGTLYERCVGKLRFAYVYLIAAVGGSVFSVAASRDLGVGASGAIFGIFGALGVYAYINRGVLGVISRRLVRSVIGLSILNLLLPLADPNIDGWAHVGGLLTGAVAGFMLGPWLSARRGSSAGDALLQDRRGSGQVFALSIILSVVVALLAVAVIVVNPAGA